jgi:hypothetical protein
MAIIVGTFSGDAEVDRAIAQLVSAGIPLEAIEPAERQDSGKDEIGLKITVDADHADKAFNIVKAHGHAFKRTEAEISYPDDRINDHRRFVTENRDTTREAGLHRDDVEILENALESHRPPRAHKPK